MNVSTNTVPFTKLQVFTSNLLAMFFNGFFEVMEADDSVAYYTVVFLDEGRNSIDTNEFPDDFNFYQENGLKLLDMGSLIRFNVQREGFAWIVELKKDSPAFWKVISIGTVTGDRYDIELKTELWSLEKDQKIEEARQKKFLERRKAHQAFKEADDRFGKLALLKR